MHDHRQPVSRLRAVFALTAGFMVVEFVGGWVANSLALLSDAGHMLSDVTALGLALLAFHQMRRPPDMRRSYGYDRLEVLSALMNGTLLCGVAVLIGVNAVKRFRSPPEIEGGLMLVVAGIGLAINLAGLALLHRGSRESIGIRGAFLHLVGDTLGSVAAIGAALTIRATGWTEIDAIASLAITILIILSGLRLLRESLHILLEGVPRHISLPEVEEALARLSGISGVHDLHIWRIGSHFDTLTVHLIVEDPSQWRVQRDAARSLLVERFGIDHCTIEVEGPGEHRGADCSGAVHRAEGGERQ